MSGPHEVHHHDGDPGEVEEPAATPTSDRIAALRVALEQAARAGARTTAPTFSSDGGVTVQGPGGGRARLQPLGQRTRISLSEGDDLVGEAEVDSDTLVAAVTELGDAYAAVAAALAVENGRSW